MALYLEKELKFACDCHWKYCTLLVLVKWWRMAIWNWKESYNIRGMIGRCLRYVHVCISCIPTWLGLAVCSVLHLPNVSQFKSYIHNPQFPLYPNYSLIYQLHWNKFAFWKQICRKTDYITICLVFIVMVEDTDLTVWLTD